MCLCLARVRSRAVEQKPWSEALSSSKLSMLGIGNLSECDNPLARGSLANGS